MPTASIMSEQHVSTAVDWSLLPKEVLRLIFKHFYMNERVGNQRALPWSTAHSLKQLQQTQTVSSKIAKTQAACNCGCATMEQALLSCICYQPLIR